MTDQPASLFTLADGVVAEMFDSELRKIADDILNTETEATDVRQIQIIIKIKPDENRNFGAVACTVKSKLGVSKGVGTILSFEKRNGKTVVVEQVSNQGGLFDSGEKVDHKTGEVS